MISWRRVALALSGLAVVAAVLAAALLKSTTPGGRGQAQIVALNQQVLAHFRSRSYREAQSVAEQVVAAVKARSGEQHADHIKALIQLAQVLIADKRAPEAEPILNRALELARATLPADAPLLADALQALGSMLGLPLGKGSDGTPLLRQALAIREKNIKADPPAYLDLVARLADIYTFATGDQAGDVQGLMARAIDLAKDDLGDRHPVVAALLAHLAEATRFRQPGTHRAAGAMEAEQGRGSDSGRARMSQQWHEAEKYNALSRAILDEAIKSGTVDAPRS
jgi:tetratricopeptide (TPR) repeat protein